MIACVSACSVSAFAQEPGTVAPLAFTLDFGTFTGIVASISLLVTQLARFIPAIDRHRLAKIGISAASGIAVCLLIWATKMSPLLDGYIWWQAAFYGLAAGLSGCGFYDVIKALDKTFNPAG